MKSNPLKLQFRPTPALVALFYILLMLTMYLLLGKANSKFVLPFAPFNNTDFYSHISNFIISYNLVTIISFIWLLQGVSLKIILWLCVICIFINIIVESFVTVLNTPDITDAWYGIAGVLLAFIFAVVAKKKGLRNYESF